MIHANLIKLINERKTWAFTGSGISIEAGYPSWSELLDRVVKKAQDHGYSFLDNHKFRQARSENNYPECFRLIEVGTNRPLLNQLVFEQFSGVVVQHSNLIKCITEFPFNGYITTNYDNLLELNLQQHIGDPWISVGNTEMEINRITGGIGNLIWHIHGMHDDNHRSKLILTTDDYNYLYKRDNEVKRHIQSLLGLNTVVYIGFGFGDFDLMYLLQCIGLFGNPLRPSYAFIGFRDMGEFNKIQEQYLDQFNVHVIPYKINGNSHSDLHRLLQLYKNFTLTRSLTFKHNFHHIDSIDPETTSLILYNELFLDKSTRNSVISEDTYLLLAKSFILSTVYEGNITRDELYDRLMCRVTVSDKVYHTEKEMFQLYLNELCNDGLIRIDQNGLIEASTSAQDLVRNAKRQSEMEKEMFLKIIENRVLATAGELINTSRVPEIAKQICNFIITKLVQQRTLSYMKILTSCDSAKDYNILGVMQSLPSYLEQLENGNEACAMSNVVLDILRSPTDKERKYLGLCMQSAFSMYALSLNESVIKELYREISSADYILDSSLIIQLLASGSFFNDMANKIVSSLSEMGVNLYTTSMLFQEVIEHIKWVCDHFDTTQRDVMQFNKFFDVDYQYGDNEFLSGYIKEFEKGKISFLEYMTKVLDISNLSENQIRMGGERTLKKYNISIIKSQMDKKCREYQELFKNVKTLRTKNASFKHDRQVDAEVEVIMTLRGVEETSLERGRFVSNTRVLDTFVSGSRIVYQPDTVLKLLNLIHPSSKTDLSILADLVMLECNVQPRYFDPNVIDRVFNPIVRSTKGDHPDAVENFKKRFGEMYGEDPESAYNNLNVLEKYNVMTRTFSQLQLLNKDQVLKEAQRITQTSQSQLSNSQLRKLRSAAAKTDKRKKKARMGKKKRRH